MPKRIQRKRVKGWHMPEGAIYVGRPTVWQNPFKMPGDGTREEVIAAFRDYLPRKPSLLRRLDELKGHDLACWCPLDQACHADLLLELANSTAQSPMD